MKQSVPYSNSIISFLLSKNWEIEKVKNLETGTQWFYMKPPNYLGIEDDTFRFEIPLAQNPFPSYWDQLSAIISGIMTLYKIEKPLAKALFYCPLSEVYDAFSTLHVNKEQDQLAAA